MVDGAPHGVDPWVEDPPPPHLSIDWERLRDLPPRTVARKAVYRCRKILRRSPLSPARGAALRRVLRETTSATLPLPSLRPSPRFFFAPGDVVAIVTAVRQDHAEEVDLIVAEADEVVAGRFRFLGYPEVNPGDPPRLAGHEPAEIDVYLDRMDSLVTLSFAFAYTRRREFLERFGQMLRAWLDREDLVDFLARERPIETAIRTVNWAFSLQVLLSVVEVGVVDPSTHRRLAATLEMQARILEAGLSPGGNHLLLEALGLRILGAAFPWLARAQQRERLGMELLDREILRQVHEDGVHAEQSTGYHLNAATYFLKDQLLRRKRGQPVPETSCARLGRMIDVVLHLTEPDGRVPMRGDLDGFRTRYREHLETRLLYPSGFALFPDQAFSYPPSLDTHLSVWYLGVQESRRARLLNRSLADSRRPGCRTYLQGGRTVLRSRPLCPHVDFDHGPFGLSDHPHHGHADALSLEICLRGRPAIVDPGGFAYHRNRFRTHFRSTAAHSTIRIDGLDQTRLLDRFRTGRLARPVGEPSSGRVGDVAFIESAHDGYLRLRAKVIHRRAVATALRDPGWVIVLDLLEGQGSHWIEQIFQLAPTLSVATPIPSGLEVDLDEETVLSLLFPRSEASASPLRLRRYEGELDPPRGWISTVKGALEPAPQIVREGFVDLPCMLATVIAAREKTSGAAPLRASMATVHDERDRRLAPEEAVALRLGSRGEEVVVWNPSLRGHTLDGQETTGRFTCLSEPRSLVPRP